MKYTEFIKRMNSLGFSIETDDAEILTCKRIDTSTVVISISKVFENSMGINIITTAPNETMAIKLATKLARTPLRDRTAPSKYEIILPCLYTSTGEKLHIIEHNGQYFVSPAPPLYGKYVFSESDMLNVPKKYHTLARDIKTGEPYITEEGPL